MFHCMWFQWNIAAGILIISERSRRAVNEHLRAIAQPIRDLLYHLTYSDQFFGLSTQQKLYIFEQKVGDAVMAARKATTNTPNTNKPTPSWESTKFINRNLTTEEKADHDARKEPIQKLCVEFVKLVSLGYAVKCSWDAYSKCFQATATVWNDANPNYGYGLSARGATPERAVSLLLYKHFHILHEDWATSFVPQARDMEG